MKKLTVSLILVSMSFLVGCKDYSPFVRFEQRIMVQLFGIDWEEDMYTVSIQFSMGTSSNAMETENDLKTITGKGVSLYAAIRDAQESVGKEFFFTHTQVVFLGEGVLNNDVIKALEDYLYYCDELCTAYVAGTYGKAEDILALTYKDEYSAKNKLFLVLENAKSIGVYPVYTIYETQINAYNKSESCFVPMIRVEESSGNENDGGAGEESGSNATGDNKNSEHPKVLTDGGALVINGKVAAYMNETKCEGLSLFINACDTSSIEFLSECDRTGVAVYSLKTLNKKTKIIPSYNGKNLTFNIRFTAKVDNASNHVINCAVIDNNTDTFRIPAENMIELKMRDCVDLSTKLGCDIFNLEDILKHYDYSSWLKVEDDWQEMLKNAVYTYHVDIRII